MGFVYSAYLLGHRDSSTKTVRDAENVGGKSMAPSTQGR